MKNLIIIIAILLFSLNSTGIIFAQESTSSEIELTQEEINQLLEEYNQSVPTLPEGEKLILYVQEGCVHCKYVEDFIKRYGVDSKVDVRDISKSDEYSNEFDELHIKYGQTQKGTPAMEYNNQLYSGDMPIAQVIQQALGLPEDATSTLYLDDTNSEETSQNDLLAIVIGGLLLSGVLGYGVYTFVSKEN